MTDVDHQHVSRNLPGDWNRLALLSTSPSTSTAIVFVHGFAGHAVKTWNQFHRLLDELSADEPWWRDSDLYFYGYDGVSASVNSNAADLTDFLSDVFPQSRAMFFRVAESAASPGNPTGPEALLIRPGPYTYKSLVLVGHSEGGVIIRLAMVKLAREVARQQDDEGRSFASTLLALTQRATLEGWHQSRLETEVQKLRTATLPPVPPLMEARIRLFAPAISGSRLTGIAGFLNESMLGKVVRPFTKSLRAYHDLESGSPALVTLRTETAQFASMWPHMPGLKAAIVWAKDDTIVADQSFPSDVEWWEEGVSHTSICKPRPEYMMPVRFAERGTR